MQNRHKVFGASTAGLRHIRDQLPCEDAWAHACGDGSMVLAIADGLSSAEYGGRGADIAVKASVLAAAELMKNPGAEMSDVIREGCQRAREALDDEAMSEDIPLASFGTTLVMALFSEGEVWCGHIGDGAVVTIAGEDVSLLSGPGESEYANETAVLTANDWEKQLRISSGPADAVLLATDGCQGALIRREEGSFTPYCPFIVPLVRSLRQFSQEKRDCNAELADLLSSDRMRALSSDDMTLVVGLVV